MKHSLTLATLLTLAALVLTACAPLPPAATPAPVPELTMPPAAPGIEALSGTDWVLTHYGPANAALDAPQDAAPTLVIAADGQVSGKGGCNSYFGSLTVTGDKLAFGQMGRTLMACDGEIMALEDAYLAALGAAERFTLENGLLSIHTQDGSSTLVFARAQASNYQGPEWNLDSLINGDVASSLLADTTITLTYEPGNTGISGTAGCNRYMAQVDAGVGSEGRFEASAIGTTKMACAPEIMEQETAFLAALQAARSYALQDSRLILSDKAGQPLLVFIAPK